MTEFNYKEKNLYGANSEIACHIEKDQKRKINKFNFAANAQFWLTPFVILCELLLQYDYMQAFIGIWITHISHRPQFYLY